MVELRIFRKKYYKGWDTYILDHLQIKDKEDGWVDIPVTYDYQSLDKFTKSKSTLANE